MPRMITSRLVIVLGLLPALAYCAQPPKDLEAFQERRTQCDHFRGEEPYDKERARFIAEQLKKYCAGTDTELAQLKKKYSDDEAVMKTLNAYDDRVE